MARAGPIRGLLRMVNGYAKPVDLLMSCKADCYIVYILAGYRAYARCIISTFLGITTINFTWYAGCTHIEICLSCNMWNEVMQK